MTSRTLPNPQQHTRRLMIKDAIAAAVDNAHCPVDIITCRGGFTVKVLASMSEAFKALPGCFYMFYDGKELQYGVSGRNDSNAAVLDALNGKRGQIVAAMMNAFAN